MLLSMHVTSIMLHWLQACIGVTHSYSSCPFLCTLDLHYTVNISTVHYSSDHGWPGGFFLLIPPQSCGACWLAPGGRWWVRLSWDANLSDSPPLVRTLLMCPTLGPDGLEREGRKREEGRRARRRKGGQREDSEENKSLGKVGTKIYLPWVFSSVFLKESS